jgi:DNA anti-recombination protein RmuC
MAGRALRNRTVETSQDDEVFIQQCEIDWPEDQPQHVGNEHELNEGTEAQATQSDTIEVSVAAHGENIKLDSTEELKNMLSSILAAIQQTNKELQKKLESSNKELKDSNKALENKIETQNKELREINNKFQKDMEIKFQGFQEKVKNDIQAETEQLTKRFDSENQNLDKRLAVKLDSGISSFANKISQIQEELRLELTTAKQNIDTVQEKVEKGLDQQLSQSNIVVELATKLVDTRVQFGDNVNQLECKLTKLDQEVNVIRTKVQESAEVILKRPWECVEQIQSQAQRDKASIETQVGRLDSQVVELRELVLSRNDSVPRVPSSTVRRIVRLI